MEEKIFLLNLSYKIYVTKFTEEIDRRLLKGEVIPAGEKIFSIFEEHTEWITKGKLNKKVTWPFDNHHHM